jgi:hypothetical protein
MVERIGYTTVQTSGDVSTTINIPADTTHVYIGGVSYQGAIASIEIDGVECDELFAVTKNAMQVFGYELASPATGNGIDFVVDTSTGFSEGCTFYIIFLEAEGDVSVRDFDTAGSNSAITLSVDAEEDDYCLVIHGANGDVTTLTWDEGFTRFLTNGNYRFVNQAAHDQNASATGTLETTSSGGATYAVASLIAFYTSGGGSVDLEGSVTCTSTAVGAITVARALAGTVPAESTVAGALTVGKALSGTVVAESTVSGTLAAGVALAGSVACVSSVAGAITTGKLLAGTVAATSTTEGALTIGKLLDGLVACESAASGDLTVGSGLAGRVVCESLTQGALSVGRALAGSVQAQSTVSGQLSADINLAGLVACQSTVTGTLGALTGIAWIGITAKIQGIGVSGKIGQTGITGRVHQITIGGTA